MTGGNGLKNLGNHIGLSSSSPKHTSEKSLSHNRLHQKSDNSSRDLASIIGIEPLAENGQGDDEHFRNDYDKTEPENILKGVKRAKTRFSKHHHQKGEPLLWLLYPERYPQVAESFRSLMNKVIALKENEKLKIFLMTGPHENAGVSTITFNLALALAFDLIDKQVLIVDTNISKPSLHTAFGYSVNPGLIDYLFGIRQLNEIIRVCDYPNLNLLPSGTIDHLTVIPFDLAKFSFFLEAVREQYDFILLDAAPLLTSPQTRAISSKADGVIIIIEANRTRWEVMRDLKQRLENDGANLVGSFINKRSFVIPKWLYHWI